jgi:hydrogenase large subunit
VGRIYDIPLNRVEGDLEIRIEVEDGVVADAWSAGTMYRGFENLLVGRGALDGLVITPRICGICSTTHQMAAAQAMDRVAGLAGLPGAAIRLRNLALAVEHIQSDVRQGVLMFLPDFTNPGYAAHPLHAEAVRRYAPLAGEAAVDAIRETKKAVEIIAMLAGQWPHSSFMVPGGVAYAPNGADLVQCRHLLGRYRDWYQRRFLGCGIERWLAIDGLDALMEWVEENPAQRESEVGFFVRFALAAGLDRTGRGHGNFLSYGGLEIPEGSAVAGSGGRLIAAGFARGGEVEAFDQARVAEHIAHSWFTGYEGGRHPFEGLTKPYASGNEGDRYSWAKAPRYRGLPAETGPLAERVVAGDRLFLDLLARHGGPSTLARQLARLTRPATLFQAMDTWLHEVARGDGGEFYEAPPPIVDGHGVGLIQAARGALGHWVKVADGRIEHYQIVTPTAWNGSPRDSAGVRGAWEEALVGTPVADPDNPVEVGHVIRSFDPCLVCSVHTVRRGGTAPVSRIRV